MFYEDTFDLGWREKGNFENNYVIPRECKAAVIFKAFMTYHEISAR